MLYLLTSTNYMKRKSWKRSRGKQKPSRGNSSAPFSRQAGPGPLLVVYNTLLGQIREQPAHGSLQ